YALIAHLQQRTRSARGARLARELPLSDDAATAQARIAEAEEARALRDEGEPLSLDGVKDLDEALISDLDDVSGPIDDAFEPGEGARLSDRASPALGGLRKRAAQVREELERRIGGLLDASHVQPHLQDRFATQRDDRFVIPVRVDARAKVRGIVHGTSQSGQTVFVEPEEIVEL